MQRRVRILQVPVVLAVLVVVMAVLAWPPTARAAVDSAEPLVYAAASLTEVLQQVGRDYAREHGGKVRFSFASSATLARQVETGARADLFVSADQDWMDYLEQRGRIRAASRIDLLGNRLVLVAPAGSGLALQVGPGMPIRRALGAGGRLALAYPASVPAGRYARAALSHLGAWAEVEGRIVAAENVRMALLFVARGEAPLGVVYATDARAEPKVRVVGEFPAASHPPIVYPAALTRGARPAAAAFLQYLSGAAARARFEAAGFSVLPGAP
jgi:molybdate transport system substrate-binding protein